jgi:hypothetical protein
VALWDNRVTAHTAISDYDVQNPEEGLRHGFRIMTLGDRLVSMVSRLFGKVVCETLHTHVKVSCLLKVVIPPGDIL